MVHAQVIVKKATDIVERANDLRALELLGTGPGNAGAIPGFTSDWVSEWGDSDADAWSQWDQLNDLSGSGIDASRYGDEFHYIVPLFQQLALEKEDPDMRAAHDLVLRQLDDVAQALVADAEEGTESGTITSIKELQDGWTGSFPIAFREKFAYKLPYTAPAQKRVVQELAAALKGHWNIIQGVRESLYSIAAETEKQLVHTIRTKFAGSYGVDATDDGEAAGLGLAVAGTALAIAAAAAALPSGGTSIGLTLAILGAVKAGGDLTKVMADGIEDESTVSTESVVIEGGTVDEIISNMNDKISELAEKTALEESRHADKIQETITSMEECMARGDQTAQYSDDLGADPSGKLIPHRLAWADEQPELDGDQFDHTTY